MTEIGRGEMEGVGGNTDDSAPAVFLHVGNEGFGSFLPRDVVHLVCEELGTQNLAWKPKTMYHFGAW